MSGKKLIKANIKFNEVSNKFDKSKQTNGSNSNSIQNSPNKASLSNSPYKLRVTYNSKINIYITYSICFLSLIIHNYREFRS